MNPPNRPLLASECTRPGRTAAGSTTAAGPGDRLAPPGGHVGLLLFVPMYNCAPQIGRTLDQVTAAWRPSIAEILVLDNGSTDGGRDVAGAACARLRALGYDAHVGKNDANYGLGGSHKVAFAYALERGHDGVVVFHGDDQGRLADLLDVADRFDAECLLGARFMLASRIKGYAPHRILANVAFNGIYSALTARALWDLGSGLNLYRRRFLERRLWEGCADDLTFNYHLLLRSAAHPDVSLAFTPISWREEDQVSNAKLWKHGVQMLGITRALLLSRTAWLTADHRTHRPPLTFTRQPDVTQ